jgi:hypothetical protein
MVPHRRPSKFDPAASTDVSDGAGRADASESPRRGNTRGPAAARDCLSHRLPVTRSAVSDSERWAGLRFLHYGIHERLGIHDVSWVQRCLHHGIYKSRTYDVGAIDCACRGRGMSRSSRTNAVRREDEGSSSRSDLNSSQPLPCDRQRSDAESDPSGLDCALASKH